jgi:hypothetical protein
MNKEKDTQATRGKADHFAGPLRVISNLFSESLSVPTFTRVHGAGVHLKEMVSS